MRIDRHSRAGFTLIELLAVIVILSILAWALVSNLGDATKSVEANATRVDMQEIGLALAEYNDDKGDFPRSKFTAEQGTPPNDVNIGSECLYLVLCAENAPGYETFDELLVNTDSDQLPRRITGFQVATLFELSDRWDNPIAYFHHSDYGREDLYATIDKDGERIETVVRALKNDKLGRHYEPLSFQLISAGVDGTFGTEDDITSFKK